MTKKVIREKKGKIFIYSIISYKIIFLIKIYFFNILLISWRQIRYLFHKYELNKGKC